MENLTPEERQMIADKCLEGLEEPDEPFFLSDDGSTYLSEVDVANAILKDTAFGREQVRILLMIIMAEKMRNDGATPADNIERIIDEQAKAPDFVRNNLDLFKKWKLT